jgi:hypothetical protein
LIAGSPTATGRPGSVTVPTPSPARKTTPSPAGNRRTEAITVAPWVTSGSSPASLTMPAMACVGVSASRASAKAGSSPFGSRIETGSGNAPERRAVSAALVAAVAQAPVVQPRRNGPAGFSSRISFSGCAMSRYFILAFRLPL